MSFVSFTFITNVSQRKDDSKTSVCKSNEVYGSTIDTGAHAKYAKIYIRVNIVWLYLVQLETLPYTATK